MASKYSSSIDLPEEIIEEVLSRVPVVGLLKFRCVSKSWLRLIDSEQFKKAQLEKSRKNTGFLDHRLIVYNYRVLQQCCLQSWLNGACLDPVYELNGSNVVGSFNGLVCVEKDAKHFIMWNPSTRIINTLPEIDSVAANHTMHVRKCGMGWFESSGEYKIFAMVPDFAKVYSSKTNSWKTVRLENSNMNVLNQKVGHFVSGKLHWLMRSSSHVVSFDLTSEVFELIELPFTTNSWCYPWLGVFGGYLCVLYDQSYDTGGVVDVLVMIMKEYGVKESWQKLEPPFPASAQFVQQQNGEYLLFFGTHFFVYSPTENVFHYPSVRYYHYATPQLCIDTLVSPILHH